MIIVGVQSINTREILGYEKNLYARFFVGGHLGGGGDREFHICHWLHYSSYDHSGITFQVA